MLDGDDDDQTQAPGGDDDAIDRLNEVNRILLEARMLPRGTPLRDEQIEAVRDAFKAYTGKREIPYTQVAREVNYASAVISDWAAGKYKGNVDKVTHAINDWMERDRRREDARRPKDYVSTWIAETMRTIAYQADKHNLMAAIVAPAGCGKSKVLKVLTEELRAIYVYCDPEITERELLFKLASLDWKRHTGATKAALRQHIVEKLADTKRMIFLDEAQQMRRSIRVVRSIYDQAEVPIVMAGTAEILQYIDDRADGRGQFASRCIRYNVIDSLRTAEGPGGGKRGGRDLFTIEEIKKFFASKQIRLSTDGLTLMWLLACQPNHGTLRLVEKLAVIALDLNRGVQLLTREHVMEALELFRGPSEATYLEELSTKYEVLAKAG